MIARYEKESDYKIVFCFITHLVFGTILIFYSEGDVFIISLAVLMTSSRTIYSIFGDSKGTTKIGDFTQSKLERWSK